jgi:hypothetical protein
MRIHLVSVGIVNRITTDSGYITTICGYDVGTLVGASIHKRNRKEAHEINKGPLK